MVFIMSKAWELSAVVENVESIFSLNILMILCLKMIFFQTEIQLKKNSFFELKSALFLHFKKAILHLKEALLQLKKALF